MMNVYDFDKTIYAGDSTLDFYRYCLKKYPKIIVYLPAQLWAALMYVLGIYNKVRFKEAFYSFLRSLPDVDRVVDAFWLAHEHHIQQWYKQQKQSTDVVISASPEFLLEPVCRRLGIHCVIASKVDKATGKYDGENCEGWHKVERLRATHDACVIDAFYSDSLSDAPLADLATVSYRVDGQTITLWSEYKPGALTRSKTVFASREFLLFLLIGTVNALNGVLFAYLFSLLIAVNAAFIAGYIVSLSISYLLNSFLNFKVALSGLKYLKFCLSYLPNFIIQNAVVVIFYNLLGWPKLFAYILAAVIGVPLTFILLKFYAFRKNTAA